MKIYTYGTGLSTLTKGNAYNGEANTGGKSPYVKEAVRMNYADTWKSFTLDIDPSENPYEIYVSAYRYDHDSTWDGDQTSFQVEDDTGQGWLRLISTASERHELEFFNGSGWVRCRRVGGAVHDTLARLDIQYTHHSIKMYLNNKLYAYYEGAITRPTRPLRTIVLHCAYRTYASHYTYWSSIFAADRDTRGVTMVQHQLTNNGDLHKDFTGDYANVGGLNNIGTGGGASVNEAEAMQTYKVSEMVDKFKIGHDIIAVGVYARGSRLEESDIVGVAGIAADGTNIIESDTVAVDENIEPRLTLIHTAPDGEKWTTEKFEACEFGVKAKNGFSSSYITENYDYPPPPLADANVLLIENGSAETGDLTGWDVNPAQPYITVSNGYDDVSPTEGLMMFKWGRDYSDNDNIWMEQEVTASRIFGRYAKTLPQVYSEDGRRFINLTWKQTKHSQTHTYGLKAQIEQYDALGNLVSQIEQSYGTANEGQPELKQLKVSLIPSADSFKVRLTGIKSGSFMWLGVDEIECDLLQS